MIKKNDRLYLRIEKELKQRIFELAKQTGTSSSQLIEDFIMHGLFEVSQRFICCPTCETPILSESSNPYQSGRDLLKCSNGHTNLYDHQTKKFISTD